MVLDSFAGPGARSSPTRARTFFDQPWIDARPAARQAVGRLFPPGDRQPPPLCLPELHGRAARRADPGPRTRPRRPPDPVPPLGTLLADTPLTLAETASIFGEGLVFEQLLAEASQAERRRPAGRQDRGRAQHRRPPDRLPPLRDPLPRRAPGGRAVARRRSAACGWRSWARAWGRRSGSTRATSTTGPMSATSSTRPSMSTPTPSATCWCAALMEKRREDPAGFAPALRGAAGRRRHEDLCRGPGALRPGPAREGLLGGRA